MAEFPEGYSEFGTALADGDFALVNKRKTLISRFWTYIQSKMSAAAVTVGSLVTSGTVDGRDVSTDGATLDAHVASTSNPHSVTAAQAGAVAVASHAALSVVGRSANSSGDVADIAAANDGEVLRRSGTSIGFGTIATAGIADAAVTEAKLSSALQTTIGDLVDASDPLAVIPSYGLVRSLFMAPGCQDFLASGQFEPFVNGAVGTGAGVSNGNATTTRPGILVMTTGTDTTGRIAMRTDLTAVLLGGGVWRFRADVNIPTASDVTNTFITTVGLFDTASTDPSYCAMFRYKYDENSGNWTTVTRNGGSETTSNTAIAAVHATSYRALEIEVNAAASQVLFYVDGALVRTETATIPSATVMCAGINVRKTAGTTARTNNLDLMGVRFYPSAGR